MKPGRFNFTTRTWFQLATLPLLAFATFLVGWSVYEAEHRIIFRAFDGKLLAASTSVAAFIDPVDHAWLMERPEVKGLAFSKEDLLFAIDTSRNVLLRIRPANGVVEDRVVPVPPGLRDLAFHGRTGLLCALELPAGRLFTLDPETGAATYRLTLGEKARGITAGPEGEVFVLADRLLRLDLEANRVTPVGSFPLPDTVGSGYDAERNIIWGINPGRRIFRIDPVTGRATAGPRIADGAPVPGDLSYDRRRHELLGASRSILQVNPDTGQVMPAHFVPAYGKELTARYQSYALPMRRILNEMDLTFLYTETFPERTKITFGLDGTQGEKHSPLHSQDDIPPEDVAGIQELVRTGKPYTSGLHKFEEWGTIKSTLAPIFDATGQVIAVTGADVDVSQIDRRTREALLTIFILGSASLLLASWASLVIARRLRRPFEQIAAQALQVAAGRYGGQLVLPSPAELHDLAETFNRTTVAVERDLATLRLSTHDLLQSRNRYELVRTLGQRHRPDDVLAGLNGVTARWAAPADITGEASGAVRAITRAVVWFVARPPDAFAAVRLRSDLALRFAAGLRTGEDLAPLPAEVIALVDLDLATRSATVFARSGAPTPTALPSGGVRFDDGHLALELTNFRLMTAATP